MAKNIYTIVEILDPDEQLGCERCMFYSPKTKHGCGDIDCVDVGLPDCVVGREVNESVIYQVKVNQQTK